MSGTQQTILVETPLVSGASCKFTDSKSASWYLPSTPGTVTVGKGNGPMSIICEKTGYNTAAISIDEGFADVTWANTIIWWGYIVDAATGAAQKYPDKFVVWLRPTEWKSPDEETAWNAEKTKWEAAEAQAKADKAKPAPTN